MRATYCGLMSEVDGPARPRLRLPEADRAMDNTLIVFTCDHGEQLGDHHLLARSAMATNPTASR